MQERLNPLKAAVLSGRASLGLWCSLASALTTEVVAGSGAGWLLIDGEHSPNDLSTIMGQLQVLGGFACEAVLRLPSDDPILIKQALDIGSRSLMIPNVRSADQACAIVAAMTYAPAGVRGFSAAHRANGFGRIAGYHGRARLRSEADRQAALAAIADGTIDVITSGHDPRGPEDKRLPFADAAPGMAGAETLLAMTLGLVRDSVIDTARAFDLLATNPARILGVPAGALTAGLEADLTLVDPDAPWIIDRRKMEATADNTPFDRQGTQGRVLGLWKGGVRLVF